MKILLETIIFVVLANVLTDCNAYLSEAAIKKTVIMLKNVCSKKFQIEEDVFENVKIGIFPEDNENLKCYFGCVFKTMQLVNPKGNIEKKSFKDKMTMLAPPSVLSVLLPAAEECAGKDQEELCQTSYNFIKCCYGVDPKSLNYLPV